jgi:hypothetical protein
MSRRKAREAPLDSEADARLREHARQCADILLGRITYRVEIRGQDGCVVVGGPDDEWSPLGEHSTLAGAKAAARREAKENDWAVRVVGSDGSVIPIAEQRPTLIDTGAQLERVMPAPYWPRRKSQEKKR